MSEPDDNWLRRCGYTVTRGIESHIDGVSDVLTWKDGPHLELPAGMTPTQLYRVATVWMMGYQEGHKAGIEKAKTDIRAALGIVPSATPQSK